MYSISDFPEIKNNFYLGSRNAGPSKKFCGKVAIITVFAKQKPDDWLPSEKKKYFSEMNKSTALLMKEAKRYGAYLEIKKYEAEISLPANANPSRGFQLIKEEFCRSTMNELQYHYEKEFGVNEAVFILAFNRNARSFAHESSTPYSNTDEISIIFFDPSVRKECAHTISHEVLHQFGAQDYYYPEMVTQAAKYCFKQSIMGLGGDVVDDLTAYLIGWKNTISEMSYTFLKSTMWMTVEKYNKALEAEWKKKW